MLEIFMGPWWSTYLHQPVLLLCNCRGWLMAGRMRGRASDGSFLRHLHCCAFKFRGSMATNGFANSCIRLTWGMAGSKCHIGSDQAQLSRRATTK